MPNWAFGTVKITGAKKDVRNFMGRFLSIYDDSSQRLRTDKYFARSFICQDLKSAYSEFENSNSGISEQQEVTHDLSVQFAWSAKACLLEGYPQEFSDTCEDLPTACAEDCVSVEIDTEEDGNCFEEHILCLDYGKELVYVVDDMPNYICKNCGNEQAFSNSEDEFTCWQCDCSGRENWIEQD